jgi:subtilisin-like proprotein convertase family protein
VTNAEVSFSASHTYLQDLEVSLRGPGGSPSHLLFSATGTTSTVVGTCAGSSNDLSTANTYTFADSASVNWWTRAATNPVPSGANRTVVTGIGGTTNPPATTSINTTFAATTANGTWSLRFRDRGAGDTGTVTAASLTLTAGPAAVVQHIVDMNGDGKTDWVVTRNTGGGPSGQITWFTQYNGVAGGQTDPFGIATDFFCPGNYDADSKTDVSVWRPGAPGSSFWYILQSTTGTLRTEIFGQTGDQPDVQGDYNNDGLDDIAVYRPGANAGDPSFWYWRQAVAGPVFNVQWGQNGDFSAPGDYDGDGKNDFVVQRNAGGGQARFWILLATGATSSTVFGTPTDVIVPGDYDGDGKNDLAVTRGISTQLHWFILPSSGGSYTETIWGDSGTDYQAQGDYDGDGKTDMAVWRPNLDPLQNYFFVNKSTGGLQTFEWGQNGDYPVANYNTH